MNTSTTADSPARRDDLCFYLKNFAAYHAEQLFDSDGLCRSRPYEPKLRCSDRHPQGRSLFYERSRGGVSNRAHTQVPRFEVGNSGQCEIFPSTSNKWSIVVRPEPESSPSGWLPLLGMRLAVASAAASAISGRTVV